jgi:predicted YcjX-like family ATPase
MEHWTTRWTKGAGEAVHRTLNTESVRLAVTGLSRAGKTVFITSAVQNLVAMGQGARTLPALADIAGPRLEGLRVKGPEGTIRSFPFAEALEALAGAKPHWPPRTTGLAGIRLTTRTRRKSAMMRAVLPPKETTLEILDYPGEWLLDLPMLNESYADWSKKTLELMRDGARAGIAKDYLAALDGAPAGDPPDGGTAAALVHLYKDYLAKARDERGLRYLQPGRYLCEGPWGTPPGFAPLEMTKRTAPGSLGAVMEERFEAYKHAVRETFVAPHFSRFDRQIVLVDLLGALHAGREAFEDTRRAVAELAACFGYGGRRWYAPWSAGIGRVLFAATKADHVPERSRDALQVLLAVMAGAEIDRIRDRAARVATLPIASVRATVDDTLSLDGRDVAAVRGVSLATGKSVKFFPGEVPLKPPGESFWSGQYFELPVFQPPKLDATGASGVPHLGLDAALAFLIGDRL